MPNSENIEEDNLNIEGSSEEGFPSEETSSTSEQSSEGVPPVYIDAAKEIVNEFPVKVSNIKPVALSENVTFQVETEDKGRWSLRFHRPGYHGIQELNSERIWVDALEQAGLIVQGTIRTRSGKFFAKYEDETGEDKRFVSLTKWIDGDLLADKLEQADLETRKALYKKLGVVAAQAHNQAENWTRPVTFSRHSLDEEGLMGENPFWGKFWENPALTIQQRHALSEGRKILYGKLAEYHSSTNNFGLIHADLNMHNVLVSEEGELALIDFDDAGFGWYAYEIAVALMHERTNKDFALILESFLEGYRTFRNFDAEDEKMIQTFFLVRALALVGWAAGRPELDHSQDLPELIDFSYRGCEDLIGEAE